MAAPGVLLPPPPSFRRAARVLVVSALAIGASCSKPEAQPAATSAPPPPPPPLATAAPSTAPASSSVAVDPAWVAPNPKLTQLLAVATPACSTRDTFMVDRDGSVAHGYDVYAPSLEQTELERRFQEAARAVGYPALARYPEGLGFRDEAKHTTGNVYGPRVSVLIARVDAARASARDLVTSLGFETWSLIEALGGGWTWLVVDRSAGSATIEVTLPRTAAKRPIVDAWARERKLEADGEAWIRKVQKGAPRHSSMYIETRKDGELSIMETRGEPFEGPACKEHPSRKAREDRDAGPKQSDEELIRQMMGK
jgi:hypothetical protein